MIKKDLKGLQHFFRTEKKYLALFVLLVMIWGATRFFGPKETEMPVSPAAKEALQQIDAAEGRLAEAFKKAGSLESYLRDKPQLAGIFTFLVFFISGIFTLGLIILLTLFFNPSWRKSWQLPVYRHDTADWGLAMLFKVIVLFLTGSYGISLVLGGVNRFLFPGLSLNFWLLLQTTLADFLCVYFIILVVKEHGGTWRDIGLRLSPRGLGAEITMGLIGYMSVFPIFVGLLFFLVLISMVFHYEPPAHPIVNVLLEEEKRSFWITAYSVALATFLAPILEEVFFRGFCYPIFRKRWGKGPAMVITSFFFAVIHQNLFAFWPIFVLGMALCYLYEKRHSLAAPMTLHLVHNTIFIAYFFLAKQALVGI